MKWYRKTGQVVKLCYGHYKEYAYELFSVFSAQMLWDQ